MRKIVIGAALLLGAALLTTGTPAKAELGCICVKLGAPAMCTSGFGACVFQGGGACVLPCDYQPHKMMKGKRHMKMHKKMKKKM